MGRWSQIGLAMVGVLALAAIAVLPARVGMQLYFWELEQLVYRDSASFLADRLGSESTFTQESLDSLSNDAQTLLPGAALLVADQTGAIVASSTSCAVRQGAQQKPESVIPYRGPESPIYPLAHTSVCSTPEHRLSGVRLEGAEDRFLLLTAPDNLLRFVFKSPTTRLWLDLSALFSLAILLLGLLGCFHVYRRYFLVHLSSLLEQAKRFAAGNFSARFTPGRFIEYRELAASFNMLTSEIERRLQELQTESAAQRHIVTELAHDLRTPTTAILGCASFLHNKNSDTAKYREIAENNLSLIDSHFEAIGEYAEFTLRSSTEIEAQAKSIELIAEAIALTQPLADAKQITIRKTDNSATLLHCQRSLLLRAIVNLLDNAIRHSPRGAEITIRSTSSIASEFAVEIENSISESAVDSGSNPNEPALPIHRSAGVGLTVVRRAATRHNGRFAFSISDDKALAVLTLNTSLPTDESFAVESKPKTPARRKTGIEVLKSTRPWSPHLLVPLLLLLLLHFHGSGAASGVIGFFLPLALDSVAKVLAETNRLRPTFARFLPLLALVPAAFLSSYWTYLLGLSLGTFAASLLWSIRTTIYARRIGVWIALLLSFVLFLSIIALHLCHFSIVEKTINEAGDAVAKQLLASLPPEVAADHIRLTDFLYTNWLTAPLADYRIEIRQGQIKESALIAAPVLIGSGRSLFFVLEAAQRGTLHENSLSSCRHGRCVHTIAESPSEVFDSISNRTFTSAVASQLIVQLFLSTLFLTALAAHWSRKFRKDFALLNRGIAEYQRQQFTSAITLDQGSSLYPLADALQSMAKRCAELELSLHNSRKSFSQFLLLSVALGREAIERCTAQSEQGRDFYADASRLRDNVEQVFQLALFARGEWEQSEHLSLSELVEEECSGASELFSPISLDQGVSSEISPNLCIAILRFLADEVRRDSAENPVPLVLRLDRQRNPEAAEIIIKFQPDPGRINTNAAAVSRWDFVNDTLNGYGVKLLRRSTDPLCWEYTAHFSVVGTK
jgi:signal transduction histidine kinase